MNVGNARPETDGAVRAAQTADGFQVGALDLSLPGKDLLISAAIVGFGVLVYASRRLNVPVDQVLNTRMTTENALTAYQSFAGIGGFIATAVASTRISTVESDTVPVRSLLMPIAIAIGSAFIAAATFPSGGGGLLSPSFD